MSQPMKILRNVLNWYFSKQTLPYWCLLLVDTAIVFLSGVFIYWVFNKTLSMFEYRFEVLYSALFYALLSWIGAKLFSTYSGVIRYSSFVDLLRVGYANGISLLLAITASLIFEDMHIRALTAFNQTEIAVTFFIATLLMWLVRITVKALHDVTFANEKSMRVTDLWYYVGWCRISKEHPFATTDEIPSLWFYIPRQTCQPHIADGTESLSCR